MKMVRYAVGAIGVAPVIGMMPTPAPAGPPVQVPKTIGKTVVLYSGAIPDIGCTGTHEAQKRTSNPVLQILTYWWTENSRHQTCIGTVKGQVSSVPSSAHLDFRIRIYINHVNEYSAVGPPYCRVHGSPPSICTGWAASDGIHEYFDGAPVQVCGAWVYKSNYKKTAYPALCKSS